MSHPVLSPLAYKPNHLTRKAMAWMAMLVSCALQCVHAGPGDASNAAPSTVVDSVPAATAPSDSTYVVKKGDTWLSLARSQYKGSPLRPEVLRDAIMAANSDAAKDRTGMPRPGARLVLPNHGQILVRTVTMFIPPQDLSLLLPPTEVVDTSPRRNWIRFP